MILDLQRLKSKFINTQNMKNLLFITLSLLFSTAMIAQTTSQPSNMTIEQYIKDNGITGSKTSPDGIIYTTEKEGNGTFPKPGDYVKVHYTGTLLDGKKFDSSVDRNDPFLFKIGQGQVIQGWDKGIPLFSIGGKGKLFLKSDLAYGERGAGSDIPPNSPLIFEIEVLDVLTQEEFDAEEVKKSVAQKKDYASRIAQYINENFAAQQAKDKAIMEAYAKEKGYEYETTASGLMVVTEKKGDGGPTLLGRNVQVHYTGRTFDGRQFDSSVDRGTPFAFPLGHQRVILGWEEGISMFNVGGKGKLIIPSSMAYGAKGSGANIPPNSPLEFDIEVLGVQ